ncbi:metal-sensitive transcriptional regulator [Deinococcus budaensis]|uniref:Copper-sensing transcriptional repressor CsoR n=1 Tax=Deinococcus budaensis TaxID=1665626 RepID=A0A7W8GF02_9DEIO|nr:metal-sensitive transcriptional regulator [Deinococcus budaensis]MBB5234345.1 DNA-binding FrmR family transcriptional regulator [Deinococcus budaensis]
MTTTTKDSPCVHGEHTLCMPESSRKAARRRLAIAHGHLESIQRMLENPDVYCVDVLKQLKAVQGALAGTGEVVLRGHLEAHVATAESRGDTSEIVNELMHALKYT